MSSAPPKPSPAARELLRAFREHESPSAHVREQGFAKLRRRLEAEEVEPAPAANGRAYGIAKATLVTVAVAAAVLLAIKAVGSGVTALADQARQPAMEAPYQGEAGSDGGQAVSRAPRLLPSPRSGASGDAAVVPEAGVPVPAGPELQAPAALEPSVRAEEPREPAASAGRSSRPRSAADGEADALEAELSLIKRATEAKKEGRYADGLAALREHAERFPRGVLADERMVLKAELHCGAGRIHEADALVLAFLRERTGSALAGRMRNVCKH